MQVWLYDLFSQSLKVITLLLSDTVVVIDLMVVLCQAASFLKQRNARHYDVNHVYKASGIEI